MNPIITTVPTLPQGPLAPVTQVLATLTQLPQSLNNLLVGALLSGTVLGRDAKGQTLLQTGSGIFGLKTNAALPVGATVTLEVQSAGAQLQTVILSVTAPGAAKPQATPAQAAFGPLVPDPALPAQAHGAGSHGQQASAAASQPASTTTVSADGTVRAIVIGPPGGGATPAPAQTAMPQPQAPSQAPASQTTAHAAVPAATAPTVTEEALPGTTAVFARAAAAPAADAMASMPRAIVPTTAQAATSPPASSPSLPAALPNSGAPPTPLPGQAPSLPTTATATHVTIQLGLPAGEAQAPTPLPPGTQMQVRVLPSLPNAAQPSPMPTTPGAVAAAPLGQAVPATIVGRTPQGQTIVETQVGRLALTLPPAAGEPVPGKLLALELSVITRPGNPEPPPLAARHSAMSITHEWPALKAAIETAAANPDPKLREALDHAVPRPGPRLAQQLLMAVAGGDTRQALVESIVRPLERAGFTELAQRIETDLQDLQKLATTPSTDWRLSFVPFFDGTELRQLRIFTRRKKNDPARKGDAGTRFVIECEHGELGALQLDGFLQKQSLDVIVRSHVDLPAWMKGDMIALFTDACGAIGMAGRLQFNSAPQFPISPMDEIAGAGTGVLV